MVLGVMLPVFNVNPVLCDLLSCHPRTSSYKAIKLSGHRCCRAARAEGGGARGHTICDEKGPPEAAAPCTLHG